jgi:DNA primase
MDYENIINSIGIKVGKSNSKTFQVICPFHNDKNFGSAFIFHENGWFHCHSCGKSVHTYHVIQHLGYKHSDIIKLLNWKQTEYKTNLQKAIFKKLNIDNFKIRNSDIEKLKIKNELSNISSIDKIKKNQLTNFDCNTFQYLVERNFNNDFIKQFNIKLIKDGIWKEYIYIPLDDSNCEIRKVNEYNHFKLLNINGSLSEMRNIFKSNKNIFLDDESYNYLSKPRVLYKNKQLGNKSIFQLDRLNRNETLYLIEGISGIPTLWNNISKNVSCTYSSEISNEQIEILKTFNKIILIPDYDEAGSKMVWKLRNLENLKCIYTSFEDTDNNFLKSIKNSLEIEPIEWILKYYQCEIRIR